MPFRKADGSSHFNQGLFKPKNPEKYRGDLKHITYRSSWELHFNQFLDSNPNILEWSSEPFAIPYMKPTDKKVHRYFPDYWLKVCNRKGEIKQYVIEIKPKKQTQLSKSKNHKTRLVENITVAINQAKWTAARKFCQDSGITFWVLTEDQLFSNFK